MPSSPQIPIDILHAVPSDLPIPVDDGACDHIEGLPLPSIALPSTGGSSVDVSQFKGWVVIFCFPMAGRPGRNVPDGWARIPGAAGCTPQVCSYRNHHTEFQRLNIKIFGLSTQTPDDQSEARLHLPYPLLSDAEFQFSKCLNLPMLNVHGLHLTKRVTLITNNGLIEKCFYPIFPPDKNVELVLEWLLTRRI